MITRTFRLTMVVVIAGILPGSGGMTLSAEEPSYPTSLTPLRTGTQSDLLGIDWKPDGAYALVVGQGVFKFDGARFRCISKDVTGNGVAWRPDGRYALIVGDSGALKRFDGRRFTDVNSGTTERLKAVAWSADGSRALIVGQKTILLYDGAVVKDVPYEGANNLEGVAFHPTDGSSLIAGIFGGSYLMLHKYDGKQVTTVFKGKAVWPGGVAWNNSGRFALVLEDWGHVGVFDGKEFADPDTGMWQKTCGLTGIDFRPNTDQDVALIVGAWSPRPLDPWQTVVLYENSKYSMLYNTRSKSPLVDVAWRPDGKRALIVGEKGILLRYSD